MLWLRTVQLGVKSLLLHPLRSLLTVLGIFIGVASVIWLLAIGEGISFEAQKQIEGLGADNIIVRSIKPPSEETANTRGPVPYGLKRFEFDAIVETVPTIKSALPIREIRRQFSRGEKMVDGRLVGTIPDYARVLRLEVDRGRFLEPADVQSHKAYCVLAAEVAQRLFPYQDPIGRTVNLIEHKDYYLIIGVMKSRSPTAAIGGSLEAQEFSNDIYVPISTMRQRIGDRVWTRRAGSFEGEEVELNQITFRVDDIKHVLATADLLKAMFDRSDVKITVPLELLEQAKTMRLMFIMFMGLIAAISLLVGGIGIMNIMLATVTERTREIGVRRALGAKKVDIIRQFLVETIVLSIAGGATGVAFGLLCPTIVDGLRNFARWQNPEFVAKLPEVMQAVTPIIVPVSIPLAFGISVVIGVVFGIYPAIRAANMDPIEALRHE